MKIENNYLNPVTPNQKPEGVQPAAKGGTHAVSSTPKSPAEISDQARLLSKARLAAKENPVERPERIQELKQQINNGSYAIPYLDLAKQLLPVVQGQKD
jgi:flagellar biosynthesis anti-sigma factor FlgM